MTEKLSRALSCSRNDYSKEKWAVMRKFMSVLLFCILGSVLSH